MIVELQICLAFLSVAALDFVWAKYTYAMTGRRPIAAGLYASAIFGLGGVAVLTYATNPWMLLPAVAGAFVGTYIAVRDE
jgi:hypothetical protein